MNPRPALKSGPGSIVTEGTHMTTQQVKPDLAAPERRSSARDHIRAEHTVRAVDSLPRGAEAPEPKTITVVVPAMNEEHNIAWVLARIPSYVDEILLVDGHSRDATVEVARRVCPDVRVASQRGCGKGAAMRTGFEDATGDYVVVLDADGSMDPGEIDYYVTALDQGYDLVKGSRELPGSGSLDITSVRRWGNNVLVSTVNTIWGSEFTDLCYGYLAFRRDRLDDLALTGRGFEIETEIAINAIKAGLRIAEVPTVELLRQYGTSNLNAWRDGRRILGFLARALVSSRERPVTDRINRRALTANLTI